MARPSTRAGVPWRRIAGWGQIHSIVVRPNPVPRAGARSPQVWQDYCICLRENREQRVRDPHIHMYPRRRECLGWATAEPCVAHTPLLLTASQFTILLSAPAGLPSSPPPSPAVPTAGAKWLLVSHITPCSRAPLKGSRPCSTCSGRGGARAGSGSGSGSDEGTA